MNTKESKRWILESLLLRTSLLWAEWIPSPAGGAERVEPEIRVERSAESPAKDPVGAAVAAGSFRSKWFPRGYLRFGRLLESPLSEMEASAVQVAADTLAHLDMHSTRLRASGVVQEMEKMRRAQRVGRIGTWEVDIQTGEITWSTDTCELFGVPEGTRPGSRDDFNQWVHPEDLPRMLEAQQRARMERELPGVAVHLDIEHRIVRRDGAVRWVHELGQLERDATGKPWKMTGTVQDITERKEREIRMEAIHQENLRLRLALEAMPAAVYIKDIQGRYQYANRECLGYFGIPSEELRGSTDSKFFPPATVARLAETDRHVFAGSESATEVDIHDPVRGRAVFWEVKTPITDPEDPNRIQGLIGISTDITDRKLAEEKLASQEEEHRELIDNLPAGLVVHSADARILIANPKACRILGLDDALGEGGVPLTEHWVYLSDSGTNLDLADHPVNQVLRTGEAIRGVVVGVQRKGAGDAIWILCNAFPMPGLAGSPQRVAVAFIDITERRALLKAIERSGQLAQSTMDALSAQICVLDSTGMILTANKAWLDHRRGRDPEDTHDLPSNYLSLCDRRTELGEHNARNIARGVREVIAGERPEFSLEFRCEQGGSPRWFHARVTRFEVADGPRVVMAHEDITERKQSQINTSRLASIVESSDDAIVGMDLDARVMSWNRGAEKIFGFSPEEMIGSPILKIIPADRHHEELLILGRIRSGKSVEHFQTQRRTKAGQLIDVSITASPIRDHLGNVVGVSKVTRDISEQKARERELARLSRLYAASSEINQAIIRAESREDLCRRICHSLVVQGGFRMAWIGWIHPEDNRVEPIGWHGDDSGYLQRIGIFANNQLGGHGPTGTAIRENRAYIYNDFFEDAKTEPWKEAAAVAGFRAMASLPIRMLGRVVGCLAVYSDEVGYFRDKECLLLDEVADDVAVGLETRRIEEARISAEFALRESEERLRELAENIAEVFWIQDVETRRLDYVSPGFERIWQRPIHELKSGVTGWIETIVEEDRARILEAAARKPLGSYDELYRIVRPDGSIRWIRDRAFPIRDEGGRVIRVVGTAIDVTEQRMLEEQLRQSQKMEAVGHLAGGVAHDFNNILAAILMQSNLAEMVEGLPEEAREFLVDIRRSAERAAALTRQLLAFSRRQVMQRRTLDLNTSVSEMARILNRTVGADVQIQIQLHPSKVYTHADPGMLDQILLNLVVNSRDAMPDGGILTIETGRETLSAARVLELGGSGTAGKYVWVRVSDTGCGMPPKILGRVFEPFFTTKEPGRGTGLGLATVFGIVQQHGGLIDLQTQVGEGTRFRVLLPEAVEGTGIESPATNEPVPKGGQERILLVEDDPRVRSITRCILQKYGYVVEEASNGTEALALCSEDISRFEIMLTDLVMPGGLGGRELARILQQKSPNLRVIFTSGYAPEIAGKDLELRPGENFIQKPALPGDLLKTLRGRP